MTGDDDDLGDLIAAARQAPGSDAVLKAMIRAARESADPASAVAFLAATPPSAYGAEAARFRAGDFLLENEDAQAALAWYGDATPAARARRARAYLAIGDKQAAVRDYRAAVEADPALRSDDLDEALSVVQARGGGAEVFDLSGRKLTQGAAETGPATLPPPARERVAFADVGGHDEVKSQINRKIVLPFAKPSLFQRFRKKAGGGVLMYGPPGCGKTLLARATAGECDAKFVSAQIPEILDMYIGQSEKRLAAMFDNARQSRPTVLFFDEIEALAARRKYVSETSQSALVSTFLSEMDGVNASNEGVLVLAATNVPWAINAAFRRPGRFDRVIFVPPPDEAARRAILLMNLKDRPQTKSINADAIAAKTSGFSGADIAGLVETAVELAIEESLKSDTIAPVSQDHLTAALKETKPSTLEWLSSARNYAKYSNQGGLYDDVVAFLDRHAR